MAYYLGQPVKVTVNIYDENDQLYDPSNLTFYVRVNGGTEVSYVYGTDAEVTTPSVGVYVLKVTGDTAGRWEWRAEVTGATPTALEGYFVISQSAFD